MALQTAAIKNDLATKYSTDCAYGALFTTAGPYTSAGTEPSGGSPAYARLAWSWGSASGGVISATAATFNVPASTTVQGVGMFSAVTAGTYYDGAAITSQTFASQGTYAVTPTFTVT